MTDNELIELALRAQEHPESLTESEIQELCIAVLETFEPEEPNAN